MFIMTKNYVIILSVFILLEFIYFVLYVCVIFHVYGYFFNDYTQNVI
jgi:hypothetical protein